MAWGIENIYSTPTVGQLPRSLCMRFNFEAIYDATKSSETKRIRWSMCWWTHHGRDSKCPGGVEFVVPEPRRIPHRAGNHAATRYSNVPGAMHQCVLLTAGLAWSKRWQFVYCTSRQPCTDDTDLCL